MPNNLFQDFPQGWEIKTLRDILSSDKYAIKRGPFGSMLKKEFFVDSGIRVFEQYNPINQDSNWKRYFVTQQKFKELESFKAGAGDLLISCSGTLGKILELPKGVEVGIINQALLKIRLDDKQILNSYFVYLFNSPYMQKIILENTIGSAIQNIASVKTLKQIQIPLPPLETQQKIVAKLESEFAKIESAKSHLEKVKETIPRLKNSLLKSAFNGELTQSYKDKKSVSYCHCEDSSESKAHNPQGFCPHLQIHNAQSPLKDSIAESKAYKIVDYQELRCNSRNDENIAQTPNLAQAPNLGGATLVAQNLQNGTNLPNCHFEHSEETHQVSACHSDLECNEREESKRYFANAQYDKMTSSCHSKGDKPEESHIADSNRDISHFSNTQYDNVDSCHSESPFCHSDLECNEREESKSHFANAQYEKDSNLPQDWEIKTLGEIGKVVSGGTPSTSNKDNFDGEIAWITPADLSGYKTKYISKGKRNLSEQGLKNSSAKLLPPNSILFSSRAPIGYVAIASNELCTNQGFKNLIPNDNVNSEYVFYFLLNSKRLAENVASGTTFKEISATNFSKLPIPLPPLETQKQIVEILDSKFAVLENLEKETNASLEKLQRLKSSFLNLAFKGELIC